jgi:hypothetical protein
MIFVLSAPSLRAKKTLVDGLRAAGHFAPFELHLLPYATMRERSAYLAASQPALGESNELWVDPLWAALSELRCCTLVEARRFADDELGPDCPTWKAYETLLALVHPRVLVDITPSNVCHINIMRRATYMLNSPCFLRLVRHPLSCIADSARRRLSASHSGSGELRCDGGASGVFFEAEQGWLSANATIQEFLDELATTDTPVARVATVTCEEMEAGGITAADFCSRCALNIPSTVGLRQFARFEKEPHVAAVEPVLALPRRVMVGAVGTAASAALLGALLRRGSGSAFALTSGVAFLSSFAAWRWRTAARATASMPRPHQADLTAPLPPKMQLNEGAPSSTDTLIYSASQGHSSHDLGGNSSQSEPSAQESSGDDLSEEGGPFATSVPAACPLCNLQSATKLMARQLGYRLPSDLPAGYCWLGMPHALAHPLCVGSTWGGVDARSMLQPTVCFPGITGGPSVFAELAPRMPNSEGGIVAVDYSTALPNGCTSWLVLVETFAEQIHHLTGQGPVTLFGYSFGCRIAYAVGGLLEAAGVEVRLVLLDGPIGGPRGVLEEAILGGSVQNGDGSLDEMPEAQQLVTLLARGGESMPKPLGTRAHVSVFVASDDAVGLGLASQYLPHGCMHRVRGSHRALLRRRGASDIGALLGRLVV